MSVLINKKTRVLVQGITGKEGSFHAEQMQAYGTKVVGGVTPGKGGSKHLGVPIFNTVEDAVKATKADASVIFVPPPFAADAILEAEAAGVALIICITEGIPVADMMRVKQVMNRSSSRLIGPNCPGIITSGECKIGIMPAFIHKKGKAGVISRSGTLTYEAVDQLTRAGIGQTTCIGIGGDPINGTSFLDAVKLFKKDKKTKLLVMIGEIGGSKEEEAAEYIKKHLKIPVIGFIAGQTAPPGRRMGHAGAIVAGGKGDAASKVKFLKSCGLKMVNSPSDIGEAALKALGMKAPVAPKVLTQKTTAPKAVVQKAVAQKATPRKAVAQKAVAPKATAPKATPRKAVAPKATAPKATPRKAVAPKAVVQKAVAPKATPRKAVAQKAVVQKAVAQKTVTKKAPKKAYSEKG